MTSRSVRRREERCRTAAPRPDGSVLTQLEGVGGHTQSFLIMTGDTLAATLNGFTQDDAGWRTLTVPVTIRASIA